MATNLSYYIATREVALRTGDISNCYKTEDGRYVLDSRLLQRILLTGDEFLHGLQGVELIDRNEALTLIAKGGYKTDDSEEAEIATNESEETKEKESDDTVEKQEDKEEEE